MPAPINSQMEKASDGRSPTGFSCRVRHCQCHTVVPLQDMLGKDMVYSPWPACL
ncbi:uncharacterized protein EI97DRAFT_430146 [Westerdykella ornata]|uniref:Uncharacterized protein n=1 Tax=Westerdykella ornata TaxID=318751 RepID=A0A6A6JUX0_WESOR|nr:uncharacterized protein EI97DRAFT_430146 [Westerdykella ornata]KAF2280420.1 hypothetical protein EI97DRAFT_430146 [Westerdykella ornata]